MKGQVPVEAVKDLSLNRANAIKEALLKKYTDLDANRFNVDGVGWDRPVDRAQPDQEPPGRDQGAHCREGELTEPSTRLWNAKPRAINRCGRRTAPAAGSLSPSLASVARPAGSPCAGRCLAWQAVLMGVACIVRLLCSLVVCHARRFRKSESSRRRRGSRARPKPLRASTASGSTGRLTRNLLTTLRRLGLGFGLAALVGVPLGVLCGCFPRVQAFFLPMTLFGRNIPVAALIPLTFSLFGIGELQKVMFIFIACVAFIVWDTARAIEEVGSQYIDTAYTLGAGTLADDRQGAAASGTAQRVQLASLAVRPGFRLHHAGRGGEVWRRGRRPGRPHQYLATARAPRTRAPDPADHPGRRSRHRQAAFLRFRQNCFRTVTAAWGSCTVSSGRCCTPGRTCGWRSWKTLRGLIGRRTPTNPTLPDTP